MPVKLKDPRIVVDVYEKKSGIPDLLRSQEINVEIKRLQVGDYVVGPNVVVERKTIRDFISCICSNRLFIQCDQLRKHFDHPVLIVEGNIDDICNVKESPNVKKHILENSFPFHDAMADMALVYRIPVIPTPNAMHTVRLLISMCAWKHSDKGPFIKKIRKTVDMRQQQLSILASLPGVGETLAHRMLEKFGTPGKALTSTASDLAKVSGMGDARAAKIRKILNSKIRRKGTSDQKTLHDS